VTLSWNLGRELGWGISGGNVSGGKFSGGELGKLSAVGNEMPELLCSISSLFV